MKTKNYIIAGLAGMILAACTSDMALEEQAAVTYDNHNVLKVEVVDGSSAVTRADYSGFPSTTFETGDAIGVYAFDGSSYAVSNIRFVKQSDGSWLPDEEVPYVDGYTYYAYFPYRSTTYTPSTSGAVDAVDTKFANFISDASNYFWKADQSTKADFTYSNLMIAKGTVTDTDDDAVTIKFTMAHKRGLAVFDGENVAEVDFSGNIPYAVGATKQFLMKPNVATSFTDDIGTYSLTSSGGEYVLHSVTGLWSTVVLTVTGPAAYAYSGETKSYSITSYKQNSAGTKTKILPWTATYDTNNDGVFNDSKPDWLTTFTASGDGSLTATNYNATVAAQTAVIGTASDTYTARSCVVKVSQSGDQERTFTIAQNAFTDTYTYYFTVTGTADFPYNGGTKTYSVRSYKQNTNRTTNVAWTATYCDTENGTYNSTKPSWLTTFTALGTGSTSTTNYNATVAAQTPTTVGTSDVYAARSYWVKISQNEGTMTSKFQINQTAFTDDRVVPNDVTIPDWTN